MERSKEIVSNQAGWARGKDAWQKGLASKEEKSGDENVPQKLATILFLKKPAACCSKQKL